MFTGQIWELYHLKHRRYCANSYHHTTMLKMVFKTSLVLKIHILKKFWTVQHMNSETSTYHLSTDIDENLSQRLSSMTPLAPVLLYEVKLKGKFTPKLFFDICFDIGLTSLK